MAQQRQDNSRLYGMSICATSAAIATALLAGVWRRSYWALALPVLLGALGGLAILFWVGWTLAFMPVGTPAEEVPFEEEE